jgi:hypothetical protein
MIINFLVCATLYANGGKDTGTNTRNYFNSNPTQTMNNPLIDKNYQFSTVDGKSSFSAPLSTCNSDKSDFLEIAYTGTSDIDINVSLDKDLDGNKESTFSFNSISGVASNGVVKCILNTWNDCKYYEWKYDGKLMLKEATLYDLGGIYCINSSCGSIALTQKKEVLNSLGAGISGAISKYHSKYLITNIESSDNQIVYFGQNFKDCSNYNNSTNGNVEYSNVDDSSLTQNAEQEMINQVSDPNSAYSVMLSGIDNQSKGVEAKSCIIKNLVTLESKEEHKALAFDGISFCLDHFFEGRLNLDKESNRFTFAIAGSSPSRNIGQNCGGAGWLNIIDMDIEKELGIDPNSIIEFKADVTTKVYGGGCPTSSQIAIFNSFNNSRHILNDACSASGAQHPNYEIDIIITAKTEKLIYSLSTTCNENYSSCQLKEEKVYDPTNNYVKTVSNFNPTGITPQKSFLKLTATKEWYVGYDKNLIDYYNNKDESGFLANGDDMYYKITRDYHCSNGNDFDFSQTLQRAEHIDKNTNGNSINSGFSFNYGDQRLDEDGNLVIENHSADLVIAPNNIEIKYCEVSFPKDNTDVVSTGENKDEATVNNTTWHVEIRECTGDDYDNCPIDSSKGELIKHACGEIDDFAEITSVLAGVEEASKDIICSED